MKDEPKPMPKPNDMPAFPINTQTPCSKPERKEIMDEQKEVEEYAI